MNIQEAAERVRKVCINQSLNDSFWDDLDLIIGAAEANQPAAVADGAKGHGHVVPRADGMKARCGGPSMCKVCAEELTQQPTPPAEPSAEGEQAAIQRAKNGYHFIPSRQALLVDIRYLSAALEIANDKIQELRDLYEANHG